MDTPHLTPDAANDATSAPARRVDQLLAHGLPARGWPTEVLCAHTRAHSVDERDAQGCRVVRAASLGLLLSTLM